MRLEHVKNNYIKYDYTFVTYKTHTHSMLTELCRALYFNNLSEWNVYRIYYNKNKK